MWHAPDACIRDEDTYVWLVCALYYVNFVFETGVMKGAETTVMMSCLDLNVVPEWTGPAESTRVVWNGH